MVRLRAAKRYIQKTPRNRMERRPDANSTIQNSLRMAAHAGRRYIYIPVDRIIMDCIVLRVLVRSSACQCR